MSKLQNVAERIHEDRILMALTSIVKRERVEVYLVGGAIRDLALDRGRQDYDFVLHGRDIPFVHKLSHKLRGHLFSMGRDEKGRVYRVLAGNDILDFNAMDGPTIGEDLERRDFTINAIAYCLHEGRFQLYPGSDEDLHNKLIRMVSPDGFDRDPLRMIRGVRYLGLLKGFRLDQKTKGVIRRKAPLIRSISVERIRMEMDRIFLSPRPPLAMEELVALGLLREIFPELRSPEGRKRTALRRKDAFSHYLRFLECLSRWNGWEGDLSVPTEGRLILSYVGLFTGTGKILATAGKGPVSQAFPSRLADEIMTRMKFSNRFRQLVKKLMDHHANLLELSRSTVDRKALKQFVHHVGPPVRLLITFSLLEERARETDESSPPDQNLTELCHRIKDLYTGEDIISPPPLVTGRDVMRLGYEPGPVVGHILHCIREKQIRGEIGDRQEALAFLRETFGKEADPQPSP
jgi:poly(A) polymerase